MSLEPEPHHSHAIDAGRAAAAGAGALAFLCLLLWASAAAETLPKGAPAWIRTFTPEAGSVRLAEGLFWSALLGAILFALAALMINVVSRSVRHSGHRA